MPKVNVYLPEDLAEAVREARVPVSAICQEALERAVRDVTAVRASEGSPSEGSAKGPFRKFTARAWRALELAEKVARDQPAAQLDTEHVLIGILDEGGNLALKVLTSLEIESEDLRQELQASMAPGGKPPQGEMPLSPLAKKAFELTTTESRQFGHNYIGCEHLLLGLLATEEGLASRVLRRMGMDLRMTRRAVQTALAGFVHARENPPGSQATADSSTVQEVLRRLDAIEKRLAESSTAG